MADDPEKVVHDEFNRMRGQLCGFIEAVGLPEKQERGAIQTLKTLSYAAEEKVIALLNGSHR